MNTHQITLQFKQEAMKLGFSACGISKAEYLEKEAPRLENWLNQDRQGEMSYMSNYFDKRLDPTRLVEGAKSVISLMYNYYTNEKQADLYAPKISKYAYGTDYHFVVKDKLKTLFSNIENKVGGINGRVFVDSAPVLEKAWAAKSGLGWIGKHSNLINQKKGSFFFLAEIIIDIELDYDTPVSDHCGSCTKCIDACPTNAIFKPYQVDGSKCISYFTIELKGAIPNEAKGKMDNWVFGCDVCQNVCPWNRFSTQHNELAFEPKEEMLNMTKREWEEITAEIFQDLFKKSPLKRSKFEGLKRNVRFLG